MTEVEITRSLSSPRQRQVLEHMEQGAKLVYLEYKSVRRWKLDSTPPVKDRNVNGNTVRALLDRGAIFCEEAGIPDSGAVKVFKVYAISRRGRYIVNFTKGWKNER